MNAPDPPPPPLARLLRYARAYRPRIAWASTFTILNKLFDLAPPALIGAAIDVVVERDASLLGRHFGIESVQGQLWTLALLTFVIWVLESLFEYLQSIKWRNLAQSLQHDLRLDAFRHVTSLELRYFEDRSTGGLMSILSDDVNQLERFLDGGASALIKVGTTVLIIGAIFFVLSPPVALFAMIPVPFVIWGSLAFQRRIAPRYATVRERVGDLNMKLANDLGGIATIKSFTAEQHETARMERVSDAYQAANRRAIVLSSAFSPLIRMVILVGFTTTLVYGGWLVLDDRLDAAAYAVLVFMTQRLLWPLTDLGATLDLYQRAMASTRRILDLIDAPPRVTSGATRLPPAETSGDVRFEGVTFAYHPGLSVLSNLDLVFPPGEISAIVGPTGCGKTTVIKLLLRFYETDADGTLRGGRITIDGHEIRDLDLGDLRRSIALVSQDVFLFHGTVHENIAYGLVGDGDTDVPRAAVIAAAMAAEAHAFIEALPNAYDTVVGERGQKLSGGQRQRVSMARAILKDAPILVLDEATSAVDNETEAAIQRSLRQVAIGRTTIVIAHRLSTIRHAHRIYVLDEGRVAERGTHDELVAAGGAYADLWRVQTGVASDDP